VKVHEIFLPRNEELVAPLAGLHTDVQKRIKEINKKAEFCLYKPLAEFGGFSCSFCWFEFRYLFWMCGKFV